jgi:hypothetical protein
MSSFHLNMQGSKRAYPVADQVFKLSLLLNIHGSGAYKLMIELVSSGMHASLLGVWLICDLLACLYILDLCLYHAFFFLKNKAMLSVDLESKRFEFRYLAQFGTAASHMAK